MIDLEAIREQSGLTLSVDGVFLYKGSPVSNEKVQELFSKGLEVRDDARTLLRVGPQWCYVFPEDTPYIVRGVTDVAGQPVVRLNDFSRESLVEETLVFTDEGTLYCRVKGRSVLARFGRTAFHQMVTDWCTAKNEGERLYLAWNDTGLEIPARDRKSLPLVVV